MFAGARPAAGRPDWRLVALAAEQDHHLPRVLAACGFDRRALGRPWSAVRRRLWPDARPIILPPVSRRIEWRRRDLLAVGDLWLQRLNSPTWLMRRNEPRCDVWVSTWDFSWRDDAGGARGEDLTALTSFMLGITYGQAGWRLARLCGYREVPLVRG